MAIMRRLIRQRRFTILLIVLILLALIKGLLIVKLEEGVEGSKIDTVFDGMWWAVGTATGVGYGDVMPLGIPGRALGMLLEVVGVLIFGMIVGMMTTSMYDERDAYYRRKTFEQLDRMEERLSRIEKQSGYVVKQGMENEDSV